MGKEFGYAAPRPALPEASPKSLRERPRTPNENMNGITRQLFPKKMTFDDITDKGIVFVTNRLNHRPRECLGYKTPFEVFTEQLHLRHTAVALRARIRCVMNGVEMQ